MQRYKENRNFAKGNPYFAIGKSLLAIGESLKRNCVSITLRIPFWVLPEHHELMAKGIPFVGQLGDLFVPALDGQQHNEDASDEAYDDD